MTTSTTFTIDFLINNLGTQHTEIIRLLTERDPNAVLLLRLITGDPTATSIVSKCVTAELGLEVTDDETAISVLEEVKALVPDDTEHQKLRANIDRLIAFAQTEEDGEVDLKAITDPFELLKFVQGNARLLLLCETTYAHLLGTLLDQDL
jgi:hypothetical protein